MKTIGRGTKRNQALHTVGLGRLLLDAELELVEVDEEAGQVDEFEEHAAERRGAEEVERDGAPMNQRSDQ